MDRNESKYEKVDPDLWGDAHLGDLLEHLGEQPGYAPLYQLPRHQRAGLGPLGDGHGYRDGSLRVVLGSLVGQGEQARLWDGGPRGDGDDRVFQAFGGPA